MAGVDLIVLAAFLAANFALGIRSARHEGAATEEFLLAGRSLKLLPFVVTLVSTWYGGVLGVGENAYRHGLSNWVILGLPYYLGALLFALLFARKARASMEYTVPDLLFDTYGRASGLLGAAMVLALSLPAAYLLMLGILLRRATGWPLSTCIAGSTAFCLLYIAARGFRSVVQAKGLQFAFMFGGFLLLLPVAALSSGGLGFLRERLSDSAFTWSGGMPAGYVAAWYFIALQTLVEPTFFQRCYAATSLRVARVGILVSILFFALFDGLTTFTGMYARALLPDLASPVDAFPALGDLLLPPVLRGLFFCALLATVLSTVDSFLLVGGITFGRDLVWRLSSGRASQVFWSRVGLVAAAALAAFVALASESVVTLWYGFGSVGTAVLLFPLLGAFYPRMRPHPRLVPWAMAIPGALTTGWLVLGFAAGGGSAWLGVEPIYPGLGIAAVLNGIGVAWRSRYSPATTG